jgi:glycosyltransferase involved in cell wall biosynthesis
MLNAARWMRRAAAPPGDGHAERARDAFDLSSGAVASACVPGSARNAEGAGSVGGPAKGTPARRAGSCDSEGEPITPIPASQPARSDLTALAREAGVQRVHVFAWRDLADAEAGGSEIHAAKITALWAEAGLDVTVRTSHAQGHPHDARRDGYRVIRRSGRYTVFPSAIVEEVTRRMGRRDAVVEIWNGVPFLTPLWFRGPRMTILHHVHRNMWNQILSPRAAAFGRFLEGTMAPPFYRNTPIVTPSTSSRDEMVSLLGIPAGNITVAPPGIDPKFSPGGPKSPHPLIVAVGRLMPPKRFDELIRVANEVRRDVADLELIIIGDGYEMLNLKQLVHDLDAGDWVRLPGRVSDEELVWLYQKAWVSMSCSTAEGWGMTMTEAAACGTPAVATRIAGHRDSVAEGRSGLLAMSTREMVDKLRAILIDEDLRIRLSEGALKHAGEFTWEACAFDCFAPLAREALRRRARSGGRRRR